jgi:hypothetical protein
MSILTGILRLARFKPDGFVAFSATPQALLNSLAPLVAFPLVGGLSELAQGHMVTALSDFLATLVALLTPLVVTEFLSRKWGCGDRWLRFAVASNWCQWALPLAVVVMALALWLLARLGVSLGSGIVGACIIALMGYGIALHWFLARFGLGVSRGRATLLVLAADLTTGILVLAPRLLAAS